jgi:hypothetical protein
MSADFDINAGEQIDLDTASSWTANYRNTNPDGTLSYYFGSEAYTELLAQEGCYGIRLYNAINELGESQIVMVGVDSNGDDLYEGILFDRSHACPPFCRRKNPLNS